MRSSPQVTLVLEASLDEAGLIGGSVRLEQGAPRPFHGWLGLTAAITELAEGAPPRSGAAERDPARRLGAGPRRPIDAEPDQW